MREFLGIIIMIGSGGFVWWYIFAALREYPHATNFFFKPVVVWIVLIGTALLVGAILYECCGIKIFEYDEYDRFLDGPY